MSDFPLGEVVEKIVSGGVVKKKFKVQKEKILYEIENRSKMTYITFETAM